jgi:hypothetical protein
MLHQKVSGTAGILWYACAGEDAAPARGMGVFMISLLHLTAELGLSLLCCYGVFPGGQRSVSKRPVGVVPRPPA